MQTTGYVIDGATGEKVLVLVRQNKDYRSVKLRKSGQDGEHFSDEEAYLNLNDKKSRSEFDALKNGQVIHL